MKVGVVIFPGSNCDQDAIYAFRNQFGCETVELWHKDHDLQSCDLIFLPGGFSYGDYLRSGAIARFSPIMQNVIEFANKGGLLMGVCNGFQILCESHLLPGALLHNDHQKFNCKNVFIKPETNNSLITSGLNLNQGFNLNVADKVSEKNMAERKIAHQELMSRANKRLNTSRKNTGSEIMFSTPAPIGGISAEDEQLYERRRAEFLREGIGSSQATEAYDTMRPVSFEMPNRELNFETPRARYEVLRPPRKVKIN